MLERGDIVVERLTGKRAIVIRVASPEEVTCRFADGRLEERFAFELQPSLSPLWALLAFFVWPVFSPSRESPAGPLSSRVRPLLVRQPGAS